ncbi:hypothetical protein [Nocardia sp. XZ_19_385]|uniref:hypothetical protein n=1 Tax=Nocardia sp. XZ_19_385 TaxID=2769488 RepID=UPI00188DC9D3|nr:hypothetical protein [Nocardia sp. XZ_19_385]
MSYLRTFVPWIVFAVVPHAYWQWAALTAVVLSVLELGIRVRAGSKPEALVIELGTALFFAVIAVLAFANPETSLHDYVPALANGMLAIIAGTSLAIRVPFTLAIAKQTAPQEVWEEPLFIRLNYVLTTAWAICFVVGAVALAFLAYSPGPRFAVMVAVFVIPVVFTLRYVAHVRAQAEASEASA